MNWNNTARLKGTRVEMAGAVLSATRKHMLKLHLFFLAAAVICVSWFALSGSPSPLLALVVLGFFWLRLYFNPTGHRSVEFAGGAIVITHTSHGNTVIDYSDITSVYFWRVEGRDCYEIQLCLDTRNIHIYLDSTTKERFEDLARANSVRFEKGA